jgi:hypothetical protein
MYCCRVDRESVITHGCQMYKLIRLLFNRYIAKIGEAKNTISDIEKSVLNFIEVRQEITVHMCSREFRRESRV